MSNQAEQPSDAPQIPNHSEHPDLSYEVCDALISRTRDLLVQCEESDDPHQARAQFDLIRSFSSELVKQLNSISDEAARETCRLQMDTLIKEGRRLAPTIPYICLRCHEPWLPEREPKVSICPDCPEEPEPQAPADPPDQSTAESPEQSRPGDDAPDGSQQRVSRQRQPRRDKIPGRGTDSSQETEQ